MFRRAKKIKKKIVMKDLKLAARAEKRIEREIDNLLLQTPLDLKSYLWYCKKDCHLRDTYPQLLCVFPIFPDNFASNDLTTFLTFFCQGRRKV